MKSAKQQMARNSNPAERSFYSLAISFSGTRNSDGNLAVRDNGSAWEYSSLPPLTFHSSLSSSDTLRLVSASHSLRRRLLTSLRSPHCAPRLIRYDCGLP